MLLKPTADDVPNVNLTPMLDVVFNLIVFFLVGTKFAQMEREIELDVPQVAEAGSLLPAPEKRVLNVYRDGGFTLDGKSVTLETLTSELTAARREYSEIGVLIRGDGQGAFQHVADALAACTKAGVADTAVCVRIGEESVKR